MEDTDKILADLKTLNDRIGTATSKLGTIVTELNELQASGNGATSEQLGAIALGVTDALTAMGGLEAKEDDALADLAEGDHVPPATPTE